MGKALDGRWLDDRLDLRGSNRAGLSRALGRDRSAVTKLVQGKRQLKLREVEVVAAHLGCPRETVMTWAGLGPTTDAVGGFAEMQQAEFKPMKPAHNEGQVKSTAPFRHPAWGALRGLITLLPDVDYTEPAYKDWKTLYGEDR